MADRQGLLAGRTGKGTRTRFFHNAAWMEIPGLDNFAVGATEPTATTYRAFEGGFAEVGEAEVADATWDLVSFLPHHPAIKALEAYRKSQDSVQFRVETGEISKFSPAAGATIAIDTSGAVTFGGNGLGSKALDLKEVARGMCFKIGGELHTITSISDDVTPVFVAESPATAVAAGSYSVVFPILRWEFTGIVKSPFETSVGRESLIASRFVVTPTQIINLPTIQTSLTE